MAASATQSWVDAQSYPFQHNYLQVQGGRMHYVDEGRGEPFLFIHGVPTWSYLWRHLIRGLSSDYRCVAPDLLGFGLSSHSPDTPQTAYAHCHTIGQLADHLDLRDITLVLHGFGGPIGLSLAQERLDRVKRIILFNTWMYDISADPAIEKAGKAFAGGFGHFLFVNMNSSPKLLSQMAGDKSHLSDDFCRAIAGPLENKDARECAWSATRQIFEGGPFFNEIWVDRDKLRETPMLLVWGMKDPVFGEKHLNRIWHEYPLADVERIEQAGHLPMEEAPPQVFTALANWLSGVETKPFRLI
ncbi:MAG TPA: alpha/beta fold hydrolase [Fimbriimonas sp.]